MPELIIMRHAKSDWDTPARSDRERPLNQRGVAAAKAMGQAISMADRQPDLVLSSPAVRARTTAELAAEAGNWTAPIQLAEGLYPGSPGDLFEALATHAGRADRVLTVGHNPAAAACASALLGDAELGMVTAAVAAFEVPSWNVSEGCARLLWMLVPRLFTDGSFHLQ